MSNEKELSAPERDMYLELFIRFVESGETPPRYLLEFMAEGARQKLANGTPWPTQSGRPSVYQSVDRRYRAALVYALDKCGIDRARIAYLIQDNISDDTFRDDRRLGTAIAEGEQDNGAEYAMHLERALDHPRLYRSEREQIEKLIEQARDTDE